jgi:hypothetical protein
MKWIGRAVLEASRHRIAAAETANADGPDDTAAPCAQLADDAIFGAPRSTLAEIVLDTLECLCNEVPGQLMLVLDQAEEVLTQKGSDLNNDSSAAFFYFLSEVYIRNINVRIVVALRTEYYGRFRDELDIRDDRLSNRPRHGGVAPYLLRSIRDRDALIRIATAPASGESGRIYNYEFDPDAAGRIVDDILMQERHGSVTPLLQAVCAVLYDDLKENDRTIRLEQYERLGGIRESPTAMSKPVFATYWARSTTRFWRVGTGCCTRWSAGREAARWCRKSKRCTNCGHGQPTSRSAATWTGCCTSCAHRPRRCCEGNRRSTPPSSA